MWCLKKFLASPFWVFWQNHNNSQENTHDQVFFVCRVYACNFYFYKGLYYFQKQAPEAFRKKGVLKNFAKFTGKHLYHSFFFNNVAGTAPAATLFSCEFCEIFNNTYLYRTPLMVASEAQYDSWKRNTVYETLKICEPYQQNLDISWDMIPKRYLLKWII